MAQNGGVIPTGLGVMIIALARFITPSGIQPPVFLRSVFKLAETIGSVSEILGPVTVRKRLAAFGKEKSGAVAVYVAVAATVLFVMAAAATDVGRGVTVRTQLQRAADSAALAGATAYSSSSTASAATTAATNYMNGAIAQMRMASSTSFSVSLSTTTSSGTVTDYKVTVTASATVATTMTTLASYLTTGVTATADNPVYNVKISLTNFSSSAADGNAIYYYIVPADLGTPSSSTQIFNNYSSTCIKYLSKYGESGYYSSSASSASSSYVTVTLTAGQKIGFELVNITGCNSYYSANGYGSAFMNPNLFYSHMSPPSLVAYPSVTKNCSLQVSTGTSPSSGSCLSSTPSLGALSCANVGSTKYYYYWNDMGGSSDDYDYNDAEYAITCSSVGSSYSGVVLTN